MFKRVLMVCIGNICRSPTAEYLLRHKLADPAIQVESAGLGALIGKPADPIAQEILAEQGVDMSRHRARQVNRAILNGFDLVLTMEERHLEAMHSMAPEIRGRAFLIGKWQDNVEIPDPYRQQRPAFEHAYNLIGQSLDTWLGYLR